MVVRPERGILQRWAGYFQVLYSDSLVISQCAADRRKQIFLHQVALACAVLKSVNQTEMRELSHRYNYPLFFKEMFGAKNEFDDLSEVRTLRYDAYFRNPAPDWAERLTGPPSKVSWLRSHLAPEVSRR